MRPRALAILAVFVSAVALAQTAQKKEWLEHVSKNLPLALCTPQGYFRQCFTVDVRECEATAIAATKDCMDKHASQVPAALSMPKDGSHWGRVIGTCAGTGTELALIKKRINSAKCNDPKNWQ